MIFCYSKFALPLAKPVLWLNSTVLCFLFLSTTFAAPTSLWFGELKKDKKITLLSSKKTVDFILTKNDEINIKLTVVEEVAAKRKSATYSKVVFFDGNSEIKKIRVKRKRVTPVVSDYELDGIFHNDLKVAFFDYTFQKSLDPIKISYEKIFYDYKFMDLLYFIDHRYDVEHSEVIINVPDWMKCRMESFNFEGNSIDQKSNKTGDLTSYSFLAKEIKAQTQEKGAPARGKIYPHIMLIPEAYKVDSKNITLMPTTKELYGWYHTLVQSVDNNTSSLQSQVNQLTTGKTEPLEKIKAIFYWVQDNIRYIAFEHGIMGFQPEACQKVYNNKYGDCKGMANLTKEMLQLAGFDARLTWLGTNDVPYNYNYPSLYADNHMICTVILDGKKIFLDPTEKYANIYNYAHRIQGRNVLIEDDDTFIIAKVPSADAQQNEQKSIVTCTIEDDLLKGTATLIYKGNRKTRFYNQINSISESDKTRWLKSYLSNAEKDQRVSFDQLPDLSNRDEDLVIDYAIEVNNRIIDLGKEKYLNPELDMEFKDFSVPEDRVLPYEFRNKYYINNTTTINLPSNWTSTYIPEPVSINNDSYSFNLNYQLKGNSIEYTKEIIIQDITILPEEFNNWNESIKALDAFYEDQLIFKVE